MIQKEPAVRQPQWCALVATGKDDRRAHQKTLAGVDRGSKACFPTTHTHAPF
jgi:hypothetical protein